jgi:hypothetical protein
MKPFKFLNYTLLKTEDGVNIHANEVFYSVNKEDIVRPRKTIKKYTIVERTIPEDLKHIFKPDNEVLWYFKSKDAARIFIRQQKIS